MPFQAAQGKGIGGLKFGGAFWASGLIRVYRRTECLGSAKRVEG